MKEFIAPRYWLTWLGIFMLWLLSVLPGIVRHGLGRLLAVLAWRFNHKRREIVLTNLAMCFPDMSESERHSLGRKHFQAMGRSLMDTGLLWFASRRRLEKKIRYEGWEYLQTLREKQKNVILHAAHSAALEFGALAISLRSPGVGPYNAAKNRLIDRLINQSRRRFGNEAFKRNDGMLAYTRALKKGQLLYTLTDEDHGPEKSVFAPLFGQSKATLPIVGRLAKLADAAVLPVITWYDDHEGKYVVSILPALDDFPTGTEEADAVMLNESLEEMILLAPEEYMWTLRLFRTRPDGGKVYQYQM